MQTLVPIGTFEEQAQKLLGKAGFDDMLEFLARRPKAGRIIQGTGGLRKIRFARAGKGKSGGTRKKRNSRNMSRLLSTSLARRRTMDDKLFKELDANLKEAVKVAKGIKAPKSVYVVLKPAEIKAIRTSVGMSQSVFANTFRLSLDTLKGWEQGKRRPDAAAANFLRMIKADPEFVQRTLAA